MPVKASPPPPAPPKKDSEPAKMWVVELALLLQSIRHLVNVFRRKIEEDKGGK